MRNPLEIEDTAAHEASFIQASIFTILILAFLIELYSFARVQDVWVDESTQLSGITLSPWEMLRWLSGWHLDRFGVPGDRMPPASYLLDWSWLRLFGPSELGFRLFHSTFVFGGALVIAVVALRRLGGLAAIVALAFLVLSPKLIRTGVEIRAYPIFFAVTCAQLATFLKLVRNQATRLPNSEIIDLKLLAAFAMLSLLAIYTHFYGVISTTAFFIALGCRFLRSFGSLAALTAAFALVALASSGVLPFITSAVDMSPLTATKEKTADQYFSFFLKLFGDSPNMVMLPAAFAFIGGTAALLVAGAGPAIARILRQKAWPSDWLYVVVIAGASIPLFASFGIKRFDVMNSNYNGWLFAPLALLVGAGAVSSIGFRPWDSGARLVAIGAMIGGACASTFFFLAYSSMFIHGPQRFVGAVFDKTEEPKAIIYESGSLWGFSYFPLVFSHRNKIIQYRASEGGGRLIRVGAADQATPQEVEAAVEPYDHLLLVDTRLRTYRDIRACEKARESCPSFPLGATMEALVQTGHWKETRVERDFGLYDTQIVFVDRTP